MAFPLRGSCWLFCRNVPGPGTSVLHFDCGNDLATVTRTANCESAYVRASRECVLCDNVASLWLLTVRLPGVS